MLGKVEVSRKRGSPNEKWIDSLKEFGGGVEFARGEQGC